MRNGINGRWAMAGMPAPELNRLHSSNKTLRTGSKLITICALIKSQRIVVGVRQKGECRIGRTAAGSYFPRRALCVGNRWLIRIALTESQCCGDGGARALVAHRPAAKQQMADTRCLTDWWRERLATRTMSACIAVSTKRSDVATQFALEEKHQHT